MRKSAPAWEDDYAWRLVNDGCQSGSAVSTLSLPLFSPIAVLFLFTLPTLYNSIEHAHQTRHSILTGLLQKKLQLHVPPSPHSRASSVYFLAVENVMCA